mgnify:CR=1 FL=1
MKNENGTKIILNKPDKMELAKWEELVIKITQCFQDLGVTVRRLTDGKNTNQ